MTRLSRIVIPLAVVLALIWSVQAGVGPWRVAATAVQAPLSIAEDETSFRIVFGLNDTAATSWNGSLTITAGTIARVEPWRFERGDRIEAPADGGRTVRWTASTRPAQAFVASRRRLSANGVIVTFRDLTSSSVARIETAQGTFEFRPAELPYARPATFLNGRAQVDRVPAAPALTGSRDDQDYPASAVDLQGTVWVAYLQFTANPKFHQVRWIGNGETRDMAELAEPTGGDQILLSSYTRGAWSAPIAITDGGGDLFKPAVAVDGKGTVWVFWTANSGGNFDLYVRPVAQGRPGAPIRLTSDRGPDIVPAAATDAAGNVWVAWQAFRNGRSEIHAARQTGDRFSDEITVASPAANAWTPAIAASPTGDVTVAWDDYRKGDYDVYFRSFDRAGRPGAEVAAAASARYEAYPSIAYDPSGRLWLAWEESDTEWGKDFAADETAGIGLYQGRWIRVRVWDGGRQFAPPDVGTVLPGVLPTVFGGPQVQDVGSGLRQSDPVPGIQPDPSLAQNRRPNGSLVPPPRPLNSFARLLVDRGGRVWLAYRTAAPTWWSGVGGVWFENVVSFDGTAWTLPIFLPHSDNVLDNRPALASTAAGELVIVRSADGRQQFVPGMSGAMAEDPYDNDLYASRLVLGSAVTPSRLEPVAADPPRPDAPLDAHVARLRAYRANIDNTPYRIVRGEFHRHTEASMDGMHDGTLWDAWRYALDVVALDWIGCCDHDYGHGREYPWWMQQKLTDIFHLEGTFTPLFSYERSVSYPEGHRNVVFAQRGIRTLPRIPRVDESTPGPAPDTQMLYRYLRHFNGIAASHTSGTNMGTDWRDNDPLAEPVVEIYQGDRQNYEMPGAPRTNREGDSIGGWRPRGFISLALEKGFKLGFEASSDHISTHTSYANLLVTAPTRAALLEAFQKRHLYAATDDILADVRSGSYLMGDIFDTAEPPTLQVRLVGTAPFARVHIIKDNRYVYSIEPRQATVEFTWRDAEAVAGRQSYYYVRGEQADGEIVWASPMWITYRGR